MSIIEGAESPEFATRKVRMSPELMADWASRDMFGRRLDWDWGEPDEEGFYTPTITTVDDGKRLMDVETLAAALDGNLPRMAFLKYGQFYNDDPFFNIEAYYQRVAEAILETLS